MRPTLHPLVKQFPPTGRPPRCPTAPAHPNRPAVPQRAAHPPFALCPRGLPFPFPRATGALPCPPAEEAAASAWRFAFFGRPRGLGAGAALPPPSPALLLRVARRPRACSRAAPGGALVDWMLPQARAMIEIKLRYNKAKWRRPWLPGARAALPRRWRTGDDQGRWGPPLCMRRVAKSAWFQGGQQEGVGPVGSVVPWSLLELREPPAGAAAGHVTRSVDARADLLTGWGGGVTRHPRDAVGHVTRPGARRGAVALRRSANPAWLPQSQPAGPRPQSRGWRRRKS
jgi:hypothetical protein